MSNYHHTPVLLQEVLQGLRPQPNQNFIDGTVGGGGHAAAILQATGPHGQLLAFDKDEQAIKAAQQNLKKFSSRVTFIHDSYANLATHVKRTEWERVDGILLDLGLSSDQLADQSRGFSFQTDAPLDMRFDPSTGQTAAYILNHASDHELEKIFREYGEEPKAYALARAIVTTRKNYPFVTTTDLLDTILAVKKFNSRSLHPATLPWQALRVAVNHEYEEITNGINAAIKILSPNGLLAVISFHSGEDRIVKNLFRTLSKNCICPAEIPICICTHHATIKTISNKTITASVEELKNNSRARSARLRIAQKLSN